MKKYLLLWILLIPVNLLSQEGTPFITHYEGSRNRDMQYWDICQDMQDVMYFANRYGLLLYDGFRWDNIRLPNTPMTLARDRVTGKIFIGALNNFGYLEKDSKGDINYVSISNDTSSIGVVTGIQFERDIILFYGDESVSVYDREAEKVSKQWFAKDKLAFTGSFYVDNNIFINVETKGLHRIDSDTLFPIVSGYLTQNCEILFTLPYSENRILAGTSDNKITIFDGIKYYDFPISNAQYLEENLLSGGVEVGENYYAFSTLYGGAIVVEKNSGDVLHTINYQNGLPDDEIYAMGSDSNEGLWLAHSYGVSRVDLELPVESFSGFPGLEGVPGASSIYRGKLYVATNTGLYILDEVKHFEEVEELYKVQQAIKVQEPARIVEQGAESKGQGAEEETEEKKPLRKVFSRLFSKKQGSSSSAKATEDREGMEHGDSASVKTPADMGKMEIEPPVQTRTVTRKRTVSKLQSIEWLYRKIEGIDTRCNSLLITDHGLIVASGSGLFSVEGKEARRLDDNRNINAISYSDNKLFIASEEGIYTADFNNNKWNINRSNFNHTTAVFSIVADKQGAIWAGGSNMIYRFEKAENGRYGEKGWYYYASEFQENCIIDCVNDTLMLFAEQGIEYFSPEDEAFIPYVNTSPLKNGATGMRYILNQTGTPWIFDGSEWYTLSENIEGRERIKRILRLFDDVSTISFSAEGECWVIDDKKGIYKIESVKENEADPRFKLFISRIYNGEGTFFKNENLVFEPGEKAIYLNLSAPHFIKETSTQYQYMIDDMMSDWSPWSFDPVIPLLFLPPGDYIIHLRARNILGRQSDEQTLAFTIKPPFTKTVWFFGLMGLAAIALFWLFTNLRQRKLVHDKKVLEAKVKERTIELEKRKNQIEVQRDEILRQKEEITSSITYARRIQEAILPADEEMVRNFVDHFVMFKPRDIVSGDFYWITQSRSYMYFAVADCTGHGVPGAFMSMLGISLLNEITGEGNINLSTGEILNILRDKIISALHQQGKDDQSSDGMDITLCKYTRKDKELEFSGAFNPLLHFRDNKLTEFKADRQPIGFFEKATKFSKQSIKIKKGDTLYLFSDGYYDQFGGPNDKRYSTRKLKSTFTGIVNMPMKEQLEELEENFQLWKGKQEQVDDVIVLGVRF